MDSSSPFSSGGFCGTSVQSSIRGFRVTVLKYIIQSKICNTGELLAMKREDPAGWEKIRQWAEEEMKHNNIEIETESK